MPVKPTGVLASNRIQLPGVGTVRLDVHRDDSITIEPEDGAPEGFFAALKPLIEARICRPLREAHHGAEAEPIEADDVMTLRTSNLPRGDLTKQLPVLRQILHETFGLKAKAARVGFGGMAPNWPGDGP